MTPGKKIIGGEVAAEVGVDLTVTGTGVKIKIIVVEVGALVKVLIIAKTVVEADMMMRSVVVVVLMEGRRFLHFQFSVLT